MDAQMDLDWCPCGKRTQVNFHLIHSSFGITNSYVLLPLYSLTASTALANAETATSYGSSTFTTTPILLPTRPAFLAWPPPPHTGSTTSQLQSPSPPAADSRLCPPTQRDLSQTQIALSGRDTRIRRAFRLGQMPSRQAAGPTPSPPTEQSLNAPSVAQSSPSPANALLLPLSTWLRPSQLRLQIPPPRSTTPSPPLQTGAEPGAAPTA